MHVFRECSHARNIASNYAEHSWLLCSASLACKQLSGHNQLTISGKGEHLLPLVRAGHRWHRERTTLEEAAPLAPCAPQLNRQRQTPSLAEARSAALHPCASLQSDSRRCAVPLPAEPPPPPSRASPLPPPPRLFLRRPPCRPLSLSLSLAPLQRVPRHRSASCRHSRRCTLGHPTSIFAGHVRGQSRRCFSHKTDFLGNKKRLPGNEIITRGQAAPAARSPPSLRT